MVKTVLGSTPGIGSTLITPAFLRKLLLRVIYIEADTQGALDI